MAKSTLTHGEAPASHFSAKVRRALLKRGIILMGLQAVPAFTGDRYFSGTAYTVSDNDTGRVLSYADVMALGGEPVRWA